MTMLLSWIIRYGHVLGAGIWIGGYALLAFLIVPMLGQGAGESLVRLTLATVRFLTYAGTLTLALGLILITRTRGFGQLVGSTWGTLILIGIVTAVVLLGIGDGALRPAVRASVTHGNARARLWALVGFLLTVLAVGVMVTATHSG